MIALGSLAGHTGAHTAPLHTSMYMSDQRTGATHFHPNNIASHAHFLVRVPVSCRVLSDTFKLCAFFRLLSTGFYSVVSCYLMCINSSRNWLTKTTTNKQTTNKARQGRIRNKLLNNCEIIGFRGRNWTVQVRLENSSVYNAHHDAVTWIQKGVSYLMLSWMAFAW